MIRRTSKLLCFLAALAVSSVVHAQVDGPSGAAEHKQRAFKAIKAGDREGARSEFAQAYELSPELPTLWNLVIAETDSGHPAEALRHLRVYMADPRAEKKKKQQGKGLMSELIAATGRLKIIAPKTVQTVDVDGVSVLLSGTVVDVAPGTHRIEEKLPSGVSRQKEVNVPAGKEVTVDFVEGELSEPTTPQPAPVPEPSIDQPPAGAQPPPPSSPHPPPPTDGSEKNPARSWLLIGGASAAFAGLVGLGVGIGYKIDQGHQSDHATDARARIGSGSCATPSSACTDLHDAVQARNRDSATAPVFLMSGGVLFAIGAGAFIAGLAMPTASAEKSSGKNLIVPVVSPTMTGASFVGHF